MRKLVLIVVVTVLVADQAVAAPATFSLSRQPSRVDSPQPGTSRVSRVFSRLQKPFASQVGKQTPQPYPQSHPKATYNTPSTKPTPPAIDSALSLATPDQKPSPDLLVAFANAAEAQQKVDLARQNLKRAVGLAPNDVSTLRAAGHFEDRQREFKVAETLYRRAIATDAHSAGAVNDLAMCLARQKRYEEAAGAFSQAIMLGPNKALYRNNIAKVLVLLDDSPAALEHLKAAHPPAVAHYNLGFILASTGDTQAAAENYQLALAADPTMDAARRALATALPQQSAPTPQVASNPQPSQPATAQPSFSYTPPGAAAPEYEGAVSTAPKYTTPSYGLSTQVAPALPAARSTTPTVAAPTFPRLLPPVMRQR